MLCGLARVLAQGNYVQSALVPATPWLNAPASGVPGLRRLNGRVRIEPAVAAAAPVRWAVWRRTATTPPRWAFAALPPGTQDVDPAGADLVWGQGVDRVGQLCPRALIHLDTTLPPH